MSFPLDTVDANHICITSWKQYSNWSHGISEEEFDIKDQFLNLLNIADRIESETKHAEPTQCAHNMQCFEDQESFLAILNGYIHAVPSNVQVVKRLEIVLSHKSYPHNIHPIKSGICIQCIQKFIVRNNGLNDIFEIWQENICDYRQFEWRSEFNNTNIILLNQPIFLKCILLPSNMKCLKTIFDLFFVSFLQNINLNSLVSKDEANQYLEDNPTLLGGLYMNSNINTMHRIEHSLSSLSSTIKALIPFLKLYHIRHLFIENKAISSVAIIFDKFMQQYVKMPHIKLHRSPIDTLPGSHKKQFEKWRKKMKTDKVFANMFKHFNSNHVIIQRLIEIFAMLYKKFRHYHRKLRAVKNEKDKKLLQEIRMQRITFAYLMYNKQQKINTKLKYFKQAHQISMTDHLWMLAAAILPYINSNKVILTKHNCNIYCANCNKQQTNDTKRFKICSDCQITYYCRKKCQKYDWNKNRHKIICKQLVESIDCSN
eukprot:91678_1